MLQAVSQAGGGEGRERSWWKGPGRPSCGAVTSERARDGRAARLNKAAGGGQETQLPSGLLGRCSGLPSQLQARPSAGPSQPCLCRGSPSADL